MYGHLNAQMWNPQVIDERNRRSEMRKRLCRKVWTYSLIQGTNTNQLTMYSPRVYAACPSSSVARILLTHADRTKRVKDARTEAQKEIEEYREKKEKEFKEYESKVCFGLVTAPLPASILEQVTHLDGSTPQEIRKPRRTRTRTPKRSWRRSNRSARRPARKWSTSSSRPSWMSDRKCQTEFHSPLHRFPSGRQSETLPESMLDAEF